MKKDIEYVTVEEVAKSLKVSPRTIHRIIIRKQLPAVRIGRQWRFQRDWIENWLEENTVNIKKRKKA